MKHIHGQTLPAPFILMGDFNAPEDNTAIAHVKGTADLTDHTPVQAVDTFRVLHPDEKIVGTFNGFKGLTEGPKIDYIFVSPEFRTLEASIMKTSRDGRYPSDHFPVTAHIRFKQKTSASGVSSDPYLTAPIEHASDLGLASAADVPHIDTMASEWLAVDEIVHMPSLHNFHEMGACSPELLGVNYLPGGQL